MNAGKRSGQRRWAESLARYSAPSAKRGVLELLVTIVPFVALWVLMHQALESVGYWACLPLMLPASGFLIRMFTIQHDCGHGSFFAERTTNDRIGRVLGVLTLIPYTYWRRTHAVHHATTGNLDKRGLGDVDLLTVAEYRELSPLRRMAYRLSRNPVVLLGIGPIYLFILKYRLPVGLMRDGREVWISVMATNAAIACAAAGMIALVGARAFLLIEVPIVLLAGVVGVWLFYVQHQFEQTYWARQAGWTFSDAALQGSTHFDLPGVLRWFTFNIGMHHVHHLASRIPSYRLPEALADHPELREVGRLTLRESVACFRLALWDDDSRRLVSFREVRALPAVAVAAPVRLQRMLK